MTERPHIINETKRRTSNQMSERKSKKSSRTLARLALLCTIYQYCCTSTSIQHVEAGGKGKVPIYMPIPIPIPVPASPPQGKFVQQHQHQQQHHFNEDEGEVKKIYLLQPVQKLQPQPQLKGGGFMGPIQTHIHMPAPQVLAQHQHQHQQQRYQRQRAKQHNPAPNYEVADERPPVKHPAPAQSELKILPIVVIPPIAPMPPIQLPPTLQAQAPRMTLTPQFNNYVVAASDRGYKKPAHRMSSGGYNSLQDHKSFSDYNFAATGSSHRDNHRMRSRSHRGNRREARPISRTNNFDDYGGGGGAGGSSSSSRSIRARQSTIDEDSIDDYDQNTRYSGQSSRASPRYSGGNVVMSSASNRRRQQLDPEQSASRQRAASSNSLYQNNRDQMLEQQQQSTVFDDDPFNVADSYSMDQRNKVRRFRQFVDGSEMGLINANSDQSREVAPLSSSTTSNQADRDYDDPSGYGSASKQTSNSRNDGYDERPSQQHSEQSAQDNDASTDNHRINHRGDPASVYYDREGELQNDARDRRLYQPGGEREIFEDDEWRFDSIKSVAHLDPIQAKQNSISRPTVTNNQTVSGSSQSSLSSNKITTLLQPPANATLPLAN